MTEAGIEKKCCVSHRAGHRPDLIERWGEREYPMPADRAIGRFHADDAAGGGRMPHRPGRIGSQRGGRHRSEEHTSELQSLMRISYAVFCLKKKKKTRPRDKQKKLAQRKKSIHFKICSHQEQRLTHSSVRQTSDTTKTQHAIV